MYTLERKSYAVSSGAPSPFYMLYDAPSWEAFSEADLEEHFDNIHALFLDRITELQDPLHTLSLYEERELLFMLEALVQVKKMLQESVE